MGTCPPRPPRRIARARRGRRGLVSPPDSADNRQVLGSGSTQYGRQPWPIVRAVCLLDTDSHELLDAALGDYGCGELTLTAGLRGLDHAITLFDCAYFSAAFLMDWQ